MVYVDTNVLIYASIEQDIEKQQTAIRLIKDLVNNEKLILSPLVMQEFIFTLSKLKIDKEIIRHDTEFYFNFLSDNYTGEMLQEALVLCLEEKNCKNINDILHMKLATKYANKLITFDSDFKKLEKYTNIQIEIL